MVSCSIIIAGFSLCFWLLLAGAIAADESAADTYGGATNQPFMVSLWGLLGNQYGTLRDVDANETVTAILMPILYWGFLFLLLVVLLNLLIAMMSDTYSSVREHSLLYWQVRMMLTSSHLLAPSHAFSCLLAASHGFSRLLAPSLPPLLAVCARQFDTRLQGWQAGVTRPLQPPPPRRCSRRPRRTRRLGTPT